MDLEKAKRIQKYCQRIRVILIFVLLLLIFWGLYSSK